ncbi:hypothetical protein VTH82DRAFT_6297 [Thermothelomyces myriococcoides]
MADKYLLRVTAGSDYELSSHVEVPVNSAKPVHIASDLVDADLCVRVQNYRGLPRGAPKSSPYFDAEPHRNNGDQYSIAIRFRLKRPSPPTTTTTTTTTTGQSLSNEQEEEEEEEEEEENNRHDVPDDGVEEGKKEEENEEKGEQPTGVSGADLQFGNDLDHPIRDRLPPGFGTALNIVKWWIDPGLEGDPYADAPYLYGPALSSFNAVHVGEMGEGEKDEQHDDDDDDDDDAAHARSGLWFDEGGDEAGTEWRRAIGAPDDAKQRMKWALRPENRDRWTWEYDRTYGVDFFNPYIDFNEFALRLPGFNLPMMKYWDGQGLRYVLRNRSTNQIYLVVLFTLHHVDDVNEDGTLKPSALERIERASGGKREWWQPLTDTEPELDLEPDDEQFQEEEALGEARRKLSRADLNEENSTKEEDID